MTAGLRPGTIARGASSLPQRDESAPEDGLLVRKGTANAWDGGSYATIQRPETPSDVSTAASEERRETRIMVLAADALVRRLLREGLGQRGFATCAAADTTEAGRLLTDRATDLVVLDTALPRSSAPALARWARGEPALRSVPIIGLARRVSPEDALKLEGLGYRAVLTQPVSLPALFRTIDTILG